MRRYGPCGPIRPGGSTSIRIGSPACRELALGSSAWRQYTDRPQEGDRREKTSLSRRSPVERPDFASSPTISTAEATSSVPPGGSTGPRARSASDSNPCLGTASLAARRAAARRGALGLRRLPAVPLVVFALLDPLERPVSRRGPRSGPGSGLGSSRARARDCRGAVAVGARLRAGALPPRGCPAWAGTLGTSAREVGEHAGALRGDSGTPVVLVGAAHRHIIA